MELTEVFYKLDFEKIKSVGGVTFSKDVRRAIQHLANEYAVAEWYACTNMSPYQRIRWLRRTARGFRRSVKSLRAMLDNIRPRLPSSWQPLVLFRDSMVSVDDLIEILNDMAEILESITGTLPRREVGHPRNDCVRQFIRGIYPLFRDAGGQSTAYFNRSREGLQDYKGQFLDLVEEILIQIGYPYHSRDALAKLIIAERLPSTFAAAKSYLPR